MATQETAEDVNAAAYQQNKYPNYRVEAGKNLC